MDFRIKPIVTSLRHRMDVPLSLTSPWISWGHYWDILCTFDFMRTSWCMGTLLGRSSNIDLRKWMRILWVQSCRIVHGSHNYNLCNVAVLSYKRISDFIRLTPELRTRNFYDIAGKQHNFPSRYQWRHFATSPRKSQIGCPCNVASLGR